MNLHGSMRIGLAVIDRRLQPVWASLIRGPEGGVACDAPLRAHILLEAVEDRRTDPAHGDVVTHSLADLSQVAMWLSVVPVGPPREKMAFVYKVLIEERKGECTPWVRGVEGA
jgi:hypothetical protein